jgi:hypothetical protein
MNERRKIEERLRRKEEEIRELEARIRDEKIYVQALQDVLKILTRSADRPSQNSSGVLRAGSGVAKTRELILQQGHPVHLLDLLRALGREPTREARASLAGSLAAYVRRGQIFSRPSPNTFGLIELGHGNEVSEEPPPEFGEDRVEREDLI